MKKISFFNMVVLLGICLLLLAVPAFAESKVPPMQAGVAYSLVDNKINHVETMKMVEWKGLSLEGGYMGDADATDHKICAILSYDLFRLNKYVDIPILDLVVFQPGAYFAAGGFNGHRLMEAETDYGLSISLIEFKW